MSTTIYQLIDEKSFTSEQREVIENASASTAIIACPGSGKTFTTARRMESRLRQWESRDSGIALLSHTNVAIRSFEEKFAELGYSELPSFPHFVGTLDAFIARFLLSNFGHLVMKCSRFPTLIKGSESFFNDSQFKVWFDKNPSEKYPRGIVSLKVGVDNGKAYVFYAPSTGDKIILPANPSAALNALQSLGQQGFYTYDHARYWGAKILEDVPRICEILAHRFQEIIVDEAQDTNLWQQNILRALEGAGTKLMLVGDPDQSIFEFGHGDATHLLEHSKREGVQNKRLSKNLRSNQKIVEAVTRFSTIEMSSNQKIDKEWQGAFIIGYAEKGEYQLVEYFQECLRNYGLGENKCAVLGRSKDVVKKLRGDNNSLNDLTTHQFAKAALKRDIENKPKEAYEIGLSLILKLCEASLKWKEIEKNSIANNLKWEIRKKIWKFIRDPQNGLPYSNLKAKTEWHPKLKNSLEDLCQELSSLLEIPPPQKLGNKVSVKDLLDVPLIDDSKLINENISIRIDTVHGVKGETFDAAMYVATAKHIKPLLKRLKNDMSENELVKIGYVAMTRPKHLLWLGIPQKELDKNKQAFLDVGFQLINRS